MKSEKKDWKTAIEKLWYKPPSPFFKRHKNKFVFGIAIVNLTAGILALWAKYDWESMLPTEALPTFRFIWGMGFIAGVCLIYGMVMIGEVDFTWIKQKVKK